LCLVLRGEVTPAHTVRFCAVLVSLVSVFGCAEPWVDVRIACTLPLPPSVWCAAWGDPVYRLSIDSPVNSRPHEVAQPISPGATAVLDIPNAEPVTLVATPCWDDGPATTGGEMLSPCGAVWPIHMTDEGILPLTFGHGPIASVVRAADAAGVRTDLLNTERLDVEISAQLPDDPWAIDCTRVVAALVNRRMRISAIRAVEPIPTGLVAPAGMWVPFSAFRPPTEGGAALCCPTGTTVLYGLDGSRLVVTVSEDHHAWFALF
jgi:hypothetical protein